MSTGARVPIDPTDRLILEHLESHGRATLPELATAVSLSASSCQRRLRRMEDAGVIRGYRAVLDAATMGRALVVFLAVTLSDHSRSTVEQFERAVLELQGLVSCHHVTGDTDYLLRVDVPDVAALDDLTRHRLTAVPGVARFTTSLATSSITDDTVGPVGRRRP